MSAGTITLRGGPFDGAVVPAPSGRAPLICQGEPVPEGMVARYRRRREKGVYTFREYDRIIGTVAIGEAS